MPTRGERVFNRIFGALVRLGVGLSHNYLLEVRGRTTGRVYGTPVNVIDVGGRRFLVAGRGRAQWVRNAEVAPDVTLKRGRRREAWTLRPLTNDEKPEILATYLDRYRRTVQRYFPIAAGSPPSAFAPFADRYPVFELRQRRD